MAVVYMRKLEEEPETYDSKFTSLTKGVNLEVQDWVLNQVNSSESILEIGCGTGSLASKMALKGNYVIAIDKNFQMINYAMQNYPNNISSENLLYQIGSFTELPVDSRSQDIVVSTFMLSELRPLEQQIFLRNVWKVLKPDGRLILAAEFVPSGFWKLTFKIKRWWYRKKLKRLRLTSTFLVKWFFNYIEPIGFKINSMKRWKHGSIQAIELKKINDKEKNEPGYYRPDKKRFKGLRSELRIYRCIFTGQVDRVPIEPGIYQSGTPNETSPIIVTANYDFTYIKVMRDLKRLDAWVLCVDSNGINVWCAARGNDFGNNQLLEAVEATEIKNLTKEKILLLPQLSAGGVAIPQLPNKSEKFPFKIKYGPVWSKHIPQFIKNKPVRKPKNMKLAKFTLFHRIRAGITHTTFLFRKLFLLPIIALIILFLAINWFNKLWWIGEITLLILLANLVMILLFPLSKFTRRFIFKGIFFGIINIVLFGSLSYLIHNSINYALWHICFYFWITFFSTMSFSGYTMATSPREIQEEYPIFSVVNKILFILSLILLALGIIFY
ncbi:MAG: methyltransferase domain-containing protein [Candidatus Hodarchaeota archaeon]